MDAQQYKAKGVILSFFIGFVAGTTPFVFMKLLPWMLHPELQTAAISQPTTMLAGIFLTGGIIGVITALMFAGDFEHKDPKEIFVYALGIPSILISTISGLSTDYKAMKEISAVQAVASSAVLKSTQFPQDIPEAITTTVPEAPAGDRGHSLFTGTAWAQGPPALQIAGTAGYRYLVVLGTYNSLAEARGKMNEFRKRKLKTEEYIPKKLELRQLAGNPPQYLVIFNRFSKPADAQRAYDLLKINDPDCSASLIRESSK